MYNDAYGEATTHNLHSSGRIILNMWRAMHQELKLTAYTFESCAAAILRMRVPEIPATVLAGAQTTCVSLCNPHQSRIVLSNCDCAVVPFRRFITLCLCLQPPALLLDFSSVATLALSNSGMTRLPTTAYVVDCAAWFLSGSARWRALRFLHNRARLNVAMLDELDLVNRTAELAKTFGIDFYSVMSRGSQYRVESMLARLAHTQNLLLVSHPHFTLVCGVD